MLELQIPLGEETFDETTNTFVAPPTQMVELEHSLFSLSKWESKWEKPFLGDEPKTDEETLSYIRYMVVTPDVSEDLLARITNDNIREINAYISAKMTATWFREDNAPKTGARKRDIVTAEIIYHWMVALTIPFECKHWHLNQLLTLIRVCNEKNNPPKKNRQSAQTIAQQRRALNAQRRAQTGSTG